MLCDHIDHIAQVAGVDHVGLGSDFDGVTQLPEGMEDVSKFPNLTVELLRRGYSEALTKLIATAETSATRSRIRVVVCPAGIAAAGRCCCASG